MVNVALAEQITGWMSLGELRFLAERASKSNLIVEAGSYCGRSTRAMADNSKASIYAIDPWSETPYIRYDSSRDLAADEYRKGQGDYIYLKFLENMYDKIKEGQVIVHKMEFHHFWLYCPDMIFIDACHSYLEVKRDILHAIMLMSAGGLLCGHDYSGSWPEVMQAVDEIFGTGIEIYESIWWIKL